MQAATLGIVVKGYPRLSETFIAQEILELERAGFDIRIIALRRPTDRAVHPVHRDISAPVSYLPEYLYDEPLRVLRALRKCWRAPGFMAALSAFGRDLVRDPTPNRIRRFGQGMVIAAEFAPELAALYAHFIHTPASAARYAAKISGLPLAISAHAKDIWLTPSWEIGEKIADAVFCVTCTRSGLEELQRHAGAAANKLTLLYHGMDLARFPAAPAHSQRDGTNSDDPIRLLSVGRAVAKKGFDIALSALAALPTNLNWRWTHIGGGPLAGELRALAGSLGIDGRCEFLGARPQEEVLAQYRQADIFMLPCRIDASGDRDGLPNVLIEAQSQGLPVIASAISGVPEFVEHEANGLLISPEDVPALTEALLRLIRDPALRAAMGRHGEKIVRGRFDHRIPAAQLAQKLAHLLGRELPQAEKSEA